MQNLKMPYALPLGLFLISAFAGTWLAYDPFVAWREFALIVGGVALGILIANIPEKIRVGGQSIPLLSLILGVLPALVVVYFLLTNDWASQIGKLTWLDPVLRWFATWQPNLPGYRLHPNSMGGVVAMLMPLQVIALKNWLPNHRWANLIPPLCFAPTVVVLAFSILGLLLSELRGAWLALIAVIGIAALWRLSGTVARRWAGDRQGQMRIVFCTAIVAMIVMIGLTILGGTSLGERLLAHRVDRWAVWRNSLDLAGDYLFTGLGLGGFEMAYSSYALLVQVGHTTHAHNLFLDVWLQQGLLGLFSFCGLVVVAVVPLVSAIGRNQLIARWQVAAVASLGVLLLHGLVDDSFYGYGGKAIPLMFVPFGVLGQAHSENSKSQPARLLRFFGGAIAVLVIVAIAFPSARAAWFTNLGALSQTRTELSVYRWPQWRIQDELRRSLEADLALVTAQYQSALALDATNAVANRRLGQIELSLGQYDAARQHLLAAYTFAPDQRATRQLLGEAYAITGEIDRAVALWQKIEVGENQLGIRVWWYEHLGERERAALVYQAAQMRGADGF